MIYNRIKKLLVVKHHGIWWIILMVYAHMVHTSMSILECPFFPDHKFPVSYHESGCSYSYNHSYSSLSCSQYSVRSVIYAEMVCEWKYWLFHRMACATCTAGSCCVSSSCHACPIGLPYFNGTTFSQGIYICIIMKLMIV